MHAPFPFEDDHTDVLRKALLGSGFSRERLAGRCGLPEETVAEVLGGNLKGEPLVKIGAALGLDAAKLLALADGAARPAAVPPVRGFRRFVSDYGGMKVNSYLAADFSSGEAAAFDTGADASAMLEALSEEGLRLAALFLTHGHGDHIFEMDRVREKTGCAVWAPEGERVPGAAPFAPGAAFAVGGLRVETRLTRGHSPGAATYVIAGLPLPVAVVGDALFSGSIGRPNVSYRDSIECALKEIFSLPDDTVLACGHGPLTTVAHEKKINPFFPGAEGDWRGE